MSYEANQANSNKQDYEVDISTIEYMLVKLTAEVNRIQAELPKIQARYEDEAEELEERIDDFEDRQADLAERMADVKERFDIYYEYATKYDNYAQLMKNSGSQEFANGHMQKIAPKLVKAERKLKKSVEKSKYKLEKLQERYQKLVSIYNRLRIKTHTDFEPKRRTGNEKEKYQRINISLPPNLKGKWAAKAEKFGVSLSEVLRYAMKELEENLPDADEIQEELRDAEEEIKEAFEELGIKKKFKFNFDINDEIKHVIDGIGNFGEVEDIDEDIDGNVRDFGKNQFGKSRKDRQSLKTRAKGIVVIHNSIPVDKLAAVLDISREDAEKIIYEIAGKGIKLNPKKDTYYFDATTDEVVEALNQVIDETDIF